jgi:hypothetical protein
MASLPHNVQLIGTVSLTTSTYLRMWLLMWHKGLEDKLCQVWKVLPNSTSTFGFIPLNLRDAYTDVSNGSSSTSTHRTEPANGGRIAKSNAKASTAVLPTHQFSTWLKETRREGAYFAGPKIAQRHSTLLQELDEILTRYEGGRQG